MSHRPEPLLDPAAEQKAIGAVRDGIVIPLKVITRSEPSNRDGWLIGAVFVTWPLGPDDPRALADALRKVADDLPAAVEPLVGWERL